MPIPHPERPYIEPGRVTRVVTLGNLSPEKGLRVVSALEVEEQAVEGFVVTDQRLSSESVPVVELSVGRVADETREDGVGNGRGAASREEASTQAH